MLKQNKKTECFWGGYACLFSLPMINRPRQSSIDHPFFIGGEI